MSRLGWLGSAVVSLAVLTLAFAMSIQVWLAGDSGVAPAAGRAIAVDVRQSSSSLQTGVRELPLRTEKGPLSDLSTETADSLTVKILQDRIVTAAEKIGLGDVVLELAEREATWETYLDPRTGAELPTFPYTYYGIDDMVAADLDLEVTSKDPDKVLDLSALLLVAAARDDAYATFGAAAPVAYSILRQSIEDHPTCDLQVQLVGAVSLGWAPADGHLSQEVERARELCPDDPTALWIRSQTRAAVLEPGWGLVLRDMDANESLLGTIADLEELKRTFAQNPAGFAGMADLLLDRADASEAVGLRPFQVREWRRDALKNIEQARVRSGDAGLALTQARALTALGQPEKAADILGDVPEDHRQELATVVTTLRAAQAAGDFEQVVELLEKTVVRFPNGTVLAGNARRLSGYGRYGLVASVNDAAMQGAGGASANDIAFIPRSRSEWLADGTCLEIDGANALVALGEERKAANWTSESFTTPAPEETSCAESNTTTPQAAESADQAQDLLRSVSDLDGARTITRVWIKNEPASYLALQRAGEVEYLDGKWSPAADFFERSLSALAQTDETELATFHDNVQPREVLELQLAATLEAAGKGGRAERRLTGTLERLEHDPEDDERAALFYVRSQLGTLKLQDEDFEAAIESLELSVDLGVAVYGPPPAYESDSGLLRGSQENNLALAHALAGQHEESVSYAKRALQRDPFNPVFLDTWAFVHDLGGDASKATGAYHKVLKQDSTSYVSANNLAVLLARDGKAAQARKLLETAIAAAPDYAIGKHNLAVLTSGEEWSQILPPNEFYGSAGRLDRSLRGESADLIVDRTIYSSGLDISKPLAPMWSYAASAEESGAGFLWGMALLIALRAAWSLGLDRFSERLVTVLTRAPRLGAAQVLWKPVSLGMGLAASMVVLAWPALSWASAWSERLIYVAIMVALAILPIAVRRVIAPRATHRYRGSLLVVLAGLIAAPFGMSIVPYPGLDDPDGRVPGRIRWAAPVVIGVLAIVFALLAVLSAVPIARFTAMASVALVASMLLPVDPFDGVQLKSRRIGLAVSAALGLATIATALQWI